MGGLQGLGEGDMRRDRVGETVITALSVPEVLPRAP